MRRRALPANKPECRKSPSLYLYIGILMLASVLTACNATSDNDDSNNSSNGNPAIALEEAFPGVQFQQPVAMAQHPQNADRWYVVEQGGQINAITKGQATKQVFANLEDRVDSGGEKGLLGMAFDPDFSTNGFIYLSYTGKPGGELTSIISRFHSPDQGQTLDTSSEEILLSVAQPYGNHNGGDIAFGPDGFLYIGLGDGGWAGDPHGHGQNPDTLLGALLRISINTTNGYTIPTDNPFANGGGRGEIYAYGLRNPWRFSFDQTSGDLWLADVGQDRYEEVNLIQNGGNYGWNIYEGKHCYNTPVCDGKGLTAPIYEYSHSVGNSITGGYVYRGNRLPELVGNYIFGDFVSGRIWALQRDQGNVQVQELMNTSHNISSFAKDRDGEMYLLSYATGKIFQFGPTN